MSYPYQINSYENYQQAWEKSVEDPEGFWGDVASNFQWSKPWDKVLDWNFKEPSIKWFDGAKLNITENCIDRHLKDKANQPAIIWEPNDPNEHHRMLTYAQLHTKVNQFSHALKNNGIKKGIGYASTWG
jgi:acetyl-CoA synthetase